jgi:hypothetical protein
MIFRGVFALLVRVSRENNWPLFGGISRDAASAIRTRPDTAMIVWSLSDEDEMQ